jgi:hypothetical protein
LFLLCEATPLAASDAQVIYVPPGESVDVFFQINTSGRVYVKIAAPAGEAPCADFWWIEWPLGTVSQLGRHCNEAVFEIPGLLAASISAKLRAGGATSQLKIGISSDEQVARGITLTF